MTEEFRTSEEYEAYQLERQRRDRRERIAVTIAAGLAATNTYAGYEGGLTLAERAVQYADALIAALDKA